MKKQKQAVYNEADEISIWHNTSLGYRLLYRYARFAFNLFYPVITIRDQANIPDGKPVIFASNHQNALMDALAMLFAANRPVYFLARADIFKNKRVAAILKYLKMMPVYRLRDEVDIISKNETTFKQTAEILSAGNYIGILPEGTHTPVKRLQTLKKGICRIAFDTITHNDADIDLHIVPVGLDYSNYHKQGSSLVVIFGKSIPVADFLNIYKENPNRGITLLRDKLSDSLKKIMINIDNTEDYEFIHGASAQTADNYLALQVKLKPEEFVWQRYKLIKQESDRLLSIFKQNPTEYHNLKASYQSLHSGGLNAKPSDKYKSSSRHLTIDILNGVISALALIMNFAPIAIAHRLSNRVKDKQFIGSFKYVASLILFPLWYLVLFLILFFTVGITPALSLVTFSFLLAILKFKYFS